MQGRRIDHMKPWHSKPGDYGKKLVDGQDVWWCHVPGDSCYSRIGNLTRHDVIEHDDGTITVSPSILIHPSGDDPGWHGHLIAGVWSTC